ncbi:hypothetical protein BIW11_03026 [Tropilaelaps mercedesae]|uniref:Uncharacterized protein n=1 Tax=Tropilaelaps mercedesae TaxID=418985 RepID=A0A1V9XT98_9ACAR|nr:hypothetical protein BIW11_03026 [Tropilaelaps mercedesae]
MTARACCQSGTVGRAKCRFLVGRGSCFLSPVAGVRALPRANRRRRLGFDRGRKARPEFSRVPLLIAASVKWCCRLVSSERSGGIETCISMHDSPSSFKFSTQTTKRRVRAKNRHAGRSPSSSLDFFSSASAVRVRGDRKRLTFDSPAANALQIALRRLARLIQISLCENPPLPSQAIGFVSSVCQQSSPEQSSDCCQQSSDRSVAIRVDRIDIMTSDTSSSEWSRVLSSKRAWALQLDR